MTAAVGLEMLLPTGWSEQLLLSYRNSAFDLLDFAFRSLLSHHARWHHANTER
jgi:hypothetical protein